MINAKPLNIRFDEIDGFTGVYDGTRDLVLFESVKYDLICNRVRYLIGEKRGIKFSVSHIRQKIHLYPYDFLPLKKTMTFHNVIILIKTVFNKDKNKYYYNIFLERALYKFLHKIETLYYDIIDVSEGIDVNKANDLKKCDICHYWYF